MDGKWPRIKIQVLGFRAHAWEPEGLANLSPQNGGCYKSIIFFWPGGGEGGGVGVPNSWMALAGQRNEPWCQAPDAGPKLKRQAS